MRSLMETQDNTHKETAYKEVNIIGMFGEGETPADIGDTEYTPPAEEEEEVAEEYDENAGAGEEGEEVGEVGEGEEGEEE